MSRRDHSGADVGVEAAHRPESPLELSVVGGYAVGGVPPGAVPPRRDQLVQHHRLARGLVGDDLTGVTVVEPIARSTNRPAASVSRRGATNTSMTCPNRSTPPVGVAPLPGDPHGGLLDLPTPHRRRAGTGEPPRPPMRRTAAPTGTGSPGPPRPPARRGAPPRRGRQAEASYQRTAPTITSGGNRNRQRPKTQATKGGCGR